MTFYIRTKEPVTLEVYRHKTRRSAEGVLERSSGWNVVPGHTYDAPCPYIAPDDCAVYDTARDDDRSTAEIERDEALAEFAEAKEDCRKSEMLVRWWTDGHNAVRRERDETLEALRGCVLAMIAWGNEEDGVPGGGLIGEAFDKARKLLGYK